MARVGDWEAKLSMYIASCMDLEFAYGTHDCATFAAGAVWAMTGEDPIPDFRDQYTDMIGSYRALNEFGNGTLEATMDHRFPTVPIGFARRGDLAMSDGSVGVVVGGVAMFVGEEDGVPGLVSKPRAEWQRAWAVD